MSQIIKDHFFFLRHAQTDWNNQKLCQGQRDIPLSQKGYQEAKAFATESVDLNFFCIVSSPLSRALETAKEIHQAHSNACFHVVEELTERYWGLLEGISSEKMYSIEHLEETDPSYSPENGVEPRSVFQQRVIKGISIAQTFHQHPLIVSHGRVFFELCRILDMPPLRQIQNCQLLKIVPVFNTWEIHIM
jgi:broad specificity phosphatase PhoE